MPLTVERARELLDYDPDTGGLTWKITRGGKARAGAAAGCLRDSGYVDIQIGGRSYKAHRLAWVIFHGVWPVAQIDHMNGTRNDNRLANLREATRTLNGQNRRKAKQNSISGLLGVSWDTEKEKFRAQIMVDGKNRRLGSYDSKHDAHAAYLKAKRAMHAGCTI